MSAVGTEWISDRSRENTPPQRDAPASDDGPAQQRTSKKRKVLSCYACRNRKMKCDRVFPVCGRCEKTGRRHECTYDPRLLEESHVNVGAQADGSAPYVLVARPADSSPSVDPLDTSRWKAIAQEKRAGLLSTKHASQFNDVASKEPVMAEEIMFRGKGFKTQFHGVTSVMSILSMYHELHGFTREALNLDHSILRVKKDFKAFRDQRKHSVRDHNTGGHGTDTTVFAMLPEKSILDAQAALYFRMCETSYRILHGPSFWKDYNAFWEKNGSDKEHAGFAAMLLLIVAITKCLTPKDDVFVGDTTADRQAAHELIDVCENWVNVQPRRRITLQCFQTQCLLLVAKRVNSVGLKQDWIFSGNLLRLAMTSGMHRDPSLQAHNQISLYDQQMKKRLWATVMELELQSSVESGLQSGLTELYFDTPAPAHIADEALSAETQQLPPEQPEEQFTSASYLTTSLKSLPLRIHLTHIFNTPSSNIQYADVLQLDAQIHAAISALPEWDDEDAMVPSALLRLQLCQYLLILHKPFAKLAGRNSRCMYSLTTCVDVCNSMIAIHGNLLSKGILILHHLRNDIIRVGLTLSQVVFQNCTLSMVKSVAAPPKAAATPPVATQALSTSPAIVKGRAPPEGPLYLAKIPPNSFVLKTLCISSVDMLERTRQMFEQKVFRLGTGYMEYWVMSAAVAMLPPPPSLATPTAHAYKEMEDALSRCRRALECFKTLALRVLGMQHDPENSLASSLRTTMSNAPQSGSSALDTGNKLGATPAILDHSSYPQQNGLGADLGCEYGSKDTNSPFDMLHDMQIDSNSWSFPDFWAFDLSGEF